MDVVISKSERKKALEMERGREEGKKRLTAKNVICHLVFCGKTFIEEKNQANEKKKWKLMDTRRKIVLEKRKKNWREWAYWVRNKEKRNTVIEIEQEEKGRSGRGRWKDLIFWWNANTRDKKNEHIDRNENQNDSII